MTSFARPAFVWGSQDFYRSLGKGKKIEGPMMAIELAEPRLFHSVRNKLLKCRRKNCK